jgi:hypothetical protein
MNKDNFMDISNVSNGWGSSNCPTCQGAQKNSHSNAAGKNGLTEEEQREVSELKKRDTEVKAHEAAHVAAGGQYVRGGASFEYQTGPDGQKYAVGGEVPIDTSPVRGDPKATIQKMQIVRAAALAPAQPSGADQAIAAKASQEAAKAQAELMKGLQSSAGPGSQEQKSANTSKGKNPYTTQGLPEAYRNPITEKSMPLGASSQSINIMA